MTVDAFEENLQTFNGTIKGTEMRDALYRCVSLLYSTIMFYDEKIHEANSKIKKLEGGD